MNRSVTKRQVASRREDLQRIGEALDAAAALLRSSIARAGVIELKGNGDPLTCADRAVNRLLRQLLLKKGEGWLSEESEDDRRRLEKRRVWEVDPLDGTREFIAGIPEWCVSVGLVEEGRAVAGGICNPSTGEVFLGSLETGLSLNGEPVDLRGSPKRKAALVLASRSEMNRGEWDDYRNAPFTVRPMGSVAYKLARVAAGLADATWTFVPKYEWDVAAGVALVKAAHGVVKTLEGYEPLFNRPEPRLDGLVAFSAHGQKVLGIDGISLHITPKRLSPEIG